MTAPKQKNKSKTNEKKSVEEVDEDDESVSVYDSADEVSSEYDSNAEDDDGDSHDNEGNSDSDGDELSDGFEDQGSSSDDDSGADNLDDDSDDEVQVIDVNYDAAPRQWSKKLTSKRPLPRGVTPPSSSDTNDNDNNDNDKTDENNRTAKSNLTPAPSSIETARWMHTDDFSSDDDDPEGTSNRTGRVPLHWYDDYDHIGYDAQGTKILKSALGGDGDALDKAMQQQDDAASGTLRVYDALNGKEVTLTPRQVELIRRIQSGAFAHPEHEAYPDYVDYFSGVNKEISGLNSNQYEPKRRFQPSRTDKLLVRRLLHRLKCGSITMEYLKGEVRDMNDVVGKRGNEKKEKKAEEAKGAFLMWKGDEEDEWNARKGPMHIAAPKVPPPGHAESYNPSEEYIPTEEEVKQWMEMDVKDRPYGLVIPKKFPNLRSVGAYQYSVREQFERCLDLYLCPRVFKRRLNIDPESLVPSLPKAADLRPFPTSQCLYYETPYDKENGNPPAIRCLTTSPDGNFMASGASDGIVRIWEVSTTRLLRSFDISTLVRNHHSRQEASSKDDTPITTSSETKTDTQTPTKPDPILALEWNPNPSHHVLLATCANTIAVIATGTANSDTTEITDALLASALHPPSPVKDPDAPPAAVTWHKVKSKTVSTPASDGGPPKQKPISAYGNASRVTTLLVTEPSHYAVRWVRWHRKGDYFVTVSAPPENRVMSNTSPATAVLIHQLSKASSQQPFRKSKANFAPQAACFHPSKPYLFVASKGDVRVYHLLEKGSLVKRLVSGCRWISSLDVHRSGDHVIVGSLDRRMVWFDMDLGSTPYKTLKYHPRALRSVSFHKRYPLMASSSDDGTVHIFHSTVYADLMRNPLVVPVKVLKNDHKVVNDLGVLASVFHPTQPWLFSGGADGKIILWQDI